MARKPTKAQLEKLLGSAVATLQGGPPTYATKDDMAGLIKHETLGQLVEFNEAMKDPTDANKIAFRATAAGAAAHANGALGKPAAAPAQPPAQSPWGGQGQAAPVAPATPAAPVAGNRTYALDNGIPIPAARRGGRGHNVYRFEDMIVGQSFFVPATDADPKPSKRIASTVSGATKRLAPKAFLVRSVDETNEGRGKGARVWRTQ